MYLCSAGAELRAPDFKQLKNKSMTPIQYKGYTIEPAYVGFQYYKTSQGIDCSCEEGNWQSNVRSASSVKDAQIEIDELVYLSGEEQHEDSPSLDINLNY